MNTRGGGRTRDRSRAAGGLVWAALALAAASGVAEQPARADDAKLAETLFKAGRALMSAGRVPEACAKFAKSQLLDPATGTLLNLAACHQAEGKLASAWAEYREAELAARRRNRPDRVRFAGERIAELERRLSYLTVHVPAEARVPGLEVTIDGRTIAAAAWDVEAPIDPGAHRVVATAAGRSPFVRVLTFAGDGQRLTVAITFMAPPLPAASTPSAVNVVAPLGPLPLEATSQKSWWGRRGTALAIGGAGVALVAVGVVFGLRAFSEWSERDDCCRNATQPCTPGLTSAWIANITLPLGLLGAGAATYRLWRGAW